MSRQRPKVSRQRPNNVHIMRTARQRPLHPTKGKRALCPVSGYSRYLQPTLCPLEKTNKIHSNADSIWTFFSGETSGEGHRLNSSCTQWAWMTSCGYNAATTAFAAHNRVVVKEAAAIKVNVHTPLVLAPVQGKLVLCMAIKGKQLRLNVITSATRRLRTYLTERQSRSAPLFK